MHFRPGRTHAQHGPWWVRAILGILVGVIAATFTSIVAAAVGLLLGLVTWNAAALHAAGRLIIAIYIVFIALGVSRFLLRPTSLKRPRDEHPANRNDG